jgi:hypothetical protein
VFKGKHQKIDGMQPKQYQLIIAILSCIVVILLILFIISSNHKANPNDAIYVDNVAPLETPKPLSLIELLSKKQSDKLTEDDKRYFNTKKERDDFFKSLPDKCEWPTYKNKRFGFTIQKLYWSMDAIDLGGNSMFIHFRPSYNKGLLLLEIKPNFNGESVKKYSERQIEEKRDSGTYTLSESKEIELAGQKAIAVSGVTQNHSETSFETNIYFIKGKNIFGFKYDGSNEDAESAANIIRTFEFIK